MSDKDNLQKLVELANIVAKPIKTTVWVLCGLLALSVCGNIYQSTIETEVTIEHNSEFNESDFNNNSVTKG